MMLMRSTKGEALIGLLFPLKNLNRGKSIISYEQKQSNKNSTIGCWFLRVYIFRTKNGVLNPQHSLGTHCVTYINEIFFKSYR